MTRHDLLIRLDEIRAVVVTCPNCGTELHIPINEHGRKVSSERSKPIGLIMSCSFCPHNFRKGDQDAIIKLVNFLLDEHDKTEDVCRIALKGKEDEPEKEK